MRKVLLPLAASLLIATPALANEARVEARGGVFWTPGYTEGTVGAAAGYDVDLGPGAFTGLEVSGDKITDSNQRVAWGFTGRAGLKPTPVDKAFIAGGYTTSPCHGCAGAEHLGGGWQHDFGKLYGKVEYRHYFTNEGQPDRNAVMGGLGVRF
jgi:hypothetical protein